MFRTLFDVKKPHGERLRTSSCALVFYLLELKRCLERAY
jgi:hypothetical protein